MRSLASRLGTIAIVLLVIVLTILIILIGSSVYFKSQASDKMWQLNSLQDIPARRVGVVFGAGVKPDKTPTTYLADRLSAAILLYQADKIDTILVSGDNRESNYNEPTAMQRYLTNNGIPGEDIVVDYAGRSTYDTCYRLFNIFSITEATLITHDYHMPRSIGTCSKLGVDSIGYKVGWNEAYATRRSSYVTREYLSNINALIELYITKPKPILGEKIDIDSTETKII